jgi:hypothetical protein
MLTDAALNRLHKELKDCIDSFGLHSDFLGQPAVVEKSAKEAERTFQGYAKAKPNRDDAYAAAREFLRGIELDDWKRDLIASVLAEPIPATANELVLASSKFKKLLEKYEAEVKAGDLWRLTWHGLLTSYFSFNPLEANASATNGWEQLRGFLERTWMQMSQQSGDGVIPDWMTVLRADATVLTKNPVDKYASQYLNGDTSQVDRLKTDLGIPQSSWFWHQLVLSAVRSATKLGDLKFQSSIPRLIELIREKPAFRDEAIEAVLIRYHDCVNAKPHEELREFVVHKDIWRNPKLKVLGIAPAWNRVPDGVWRMVMAWVTERALKDFFDILAARNSSDAGRLAFWSKYLQQITWTRLVFGSETMALQYSNKAVKELIARERGDYAELLANKKSDAFMMQIGNFIAVEFSVTSNAAYVYEVKNLKFDRNSKYYNGGTDDLKYGFSSGEGVRILHPPGWEETATYQLKQLGIYPDVKSSSRSTFASAAPSVANADLENRGVEVEKSRAPNFEQKVGDTARFSMAKLHHLVESFNGAKIRDERGSWLGGRLWVEDANQSRFLSDELEKLGFWWSNAKEAWYYRGD